MTPRFLSFLRGCFGLCLSFLLMGCVIESPNKLHNDADAVPIEALMVGSSAAFASGKGDYIFLRRKQGRMTVTLNKFSGAIGEGKAFPTALYQMAGMPNSVYVAVRSGDGMHEYVPFHHDRAGILLLAPRSRTRVESIEAFRKALTNVPGQPVFYEKLDRAAGETAYKRYAKREAVRKKAAKARAYEYISPFRTFDQGIRRLKVGDQVYWVRENAMDLMQVREINISTGYLQLRRMTDLIDAKVHHSRVMTIKAAGEHGIKHGVSVARSGFCLARPKSCEW